VSVSGLEDAVAVQEVLDLDGAATDEPSAEQRALEDAVGSVRERFGADAVGSAAYLERGRLRTGRRASLWGPDDESDDPVDDREDEER
jgi:hypothetical protein